MLLYFAHFCNRYQQLGMHLSSAHRSSTYVANEIQHVKTLAEQELSQERAAHAATKAELQRQVFFQKL